MSIINKISFKLIFYATLILRREWFLGYLKELNKTQYSSRDEIRDFQNERLNDLLKHAQENIPFYKKLADRQGIEYDITKFPLIDKDLIRKNKDEFVCKIGVNQRDKTSGGSTGAPVTILKDSAGMAKEMAATWRGYQWAGIHIGDKQARFWGIPKNHKDRYRARLIDFVCHRIRVSAFGYDSKKFESAAKRLNRFEPDYFYGYVSIIKDFSKFQRESKEVKVKPKSIICTSEVLTESDRQSIEQIFGAKVFNEYGCGEVGTIAHECEHGGMHVSSENMLLEVLDEEGNNLGPGYRGELVVTDLTNYSMPLIRYRLNDYATLSDEFCQCGRTLPLIDKIHGRQYDTLANNSGKQFHGEFFLYIVEDIRKTGITVDGVQFIQLPDLSIKVNVVIDNKYFDYFCKFVTEQILKDFDRDVNINIERVKDIPRETSGKLRVVKRVT